MKRNQTLFVTAIIITLLVNITCKKENNISVGEVKLIHSQFVGCSGYLKSNFIIPYFHDTMICSMQNDTLYLGVYMQYNCCGYLEDSVEIDGSNVNIFISDTCTRNCQCHCICNNNFYYQFSDFRHKNIRFKVYLKEYEQNSYQLWREARFIDGLD